MCYKIHFNPQRILDFSTVAHIFNNVEIEPKYSFIFMYANFLLMWVNLQLGHRDNETKQLYNPLNPAHHNFTMCTIINV
jgi:hypothetical protein